MILYIITITFKNDRDNYLRIVLYKNGKMEIIQLLVRYQMGRLANYKMVNIKLLVKLKMEMLAN